MLAISRRVRCEKLPGEDTGPTESVVASGALIAAGTLGTFQRFTITKRIDQAFSPVGQQQRIHADADKTGPHLNVVIRLLLIQRHQPSRFSCSIDGAK